MKISRLKFTAWPAFFGAWLAAGWFAGGTSAQATALDDYVHAADTNFSWRVLKTWQQEGFHVTQISFTSQRWQEGLWTNDVWILQPPELRHPEIAALFVMGDNATNNLRTAGEAALRAGAWAVVLARVPNQPLYDGRREDALIAFTFDKFLKTGDESWLLLLPMVKSAVRTMDLTQSWLASQHLSPPEKFVVTGASKRGWTTWLTAAVDARVTAIAPRVFDMLNLKAQTDWAQKVYGRQSEQIRDYTALGLVDKMDTPEMARLRSIVDPFSYRDRLVMPKLILIGANDPYWTVDSLRHYWNELPGSKWIYDLPNAGHSLGRESNHDFNTFFEMLADGVELPAMTWQMNGDETPAVKVNFNQPAKRALLWTADAPTRDFRPAKWSSRELPLKPAARELAATIKKPVAGYRAFMVELTFAAPAGELRLSTQVQVVPDLPK